MVSIRTFRSALISLAVIVHAPVTGNENRILGLPPVPTPIDNPLSPLKTALGKRLFEDTRLSADGKVSCSGCHQENRAFTDSRVVAIGLRDARGTRNTPSLLNSAYLTSLFWDGRRASLEEQAKDPFFNPIEHGLGSKHDLLRTVRGDPEYVSAFREAFGVGMDAIDLPHVVMALASYERTLVAGDSPFDRYLFGGDQHALSASAVRGLKVFRERARCATCHTIQNDHALFSDNKFHGLGIGLENIATRLPELAKSVSHMGTEQVDESISRRIDVASLGRYVVTRKPSDIGKFRTPSLRNIALTPPYMHDGSIATLEEAIERELYYRGLVDGQPILLDVQEKKDLAAFLNSLTSTSLAVPDSKDRTD